MPSDTRTGSPRGFWAITSYFNLSKSPFRSANYASFRRHLQVPLLTVEFALDGDFDLTPDDAEILHQVTGGDILWQKERLLNLALDRLPDDCTHIAWVDSDVVFPSPAWATRTMKLLETARYVQPYREVAHLEQGAVRFEIGTGQATHRNVGLAYAMSQGFAPVDGFNIDRRTGRAIGLVWAAARDVMSRFRFFDRCIVGGGDTAAACAAYGSFEIVERLHAMNDAQKACYRRWAEPFYEVVRGEVGFVDTQLLHLWHGDMSARKAFSRHHGLAPFQFCPENDIAIGAQGCWNWSSDKPGMHEYLRGYFRARGD